MVRTSFAPWCLRSRLTCGTERACVCACARWPAVCVFVLVSARVPVCARPNAYLCVFLCACIYACGRVCVRACTRAFERLCCRERRTKTLARSLHESMTETSFTWASKIQEVLYEYVCMYLFLYECVCLYLFLYEYACMYLFFG